MIGTDYTRPTAVQTHVCVEVTQVRGVSLRASRLEFLEILIAAGWGDTPQDRIPRNPRKGWG